MGRKRKSATGEGPSNPTDTVSPMENMEKQRGKEISGSSPAKKRGKKVRNAVVRRSGRLKNTSSSRPNNEVVLEEIDLVDNDEQDTPVNEEPPPPHMDELNNTGPNSSRGIMDSKIDFIVQSVKEIKKSEEVNFKELYIDSRRKIDSLMEENQELTKKLEFAHGKIEAYEQMKDVFRNPNLAKVVEPLVNLSSSQAGRCCNLPVVSPTASPPPPPPPAANNNNGNSQVVLASPTPPDEPMTSIEKSPRGRNKSR